jgi:two-component system response regulator
MVSNYPASDPAFRVALGKASESAVRLLVIEDDLNDQELLLKKLRQANIIDHILFVNDGRKAMQLLSQDNKQTKLVAIFLDLSLRGISGLKILQQIRSRPEMARLPVIVITGSEDPEDRKECERLKVTSYLAKPINFQSFCMALANVFDSPQ